jgi:chemotaxis protein MotB
MNKTRTLATALASTVLLFFGSCASQKTLKQYQDEVRVLREERTQLKKENRDLRAQNEAYEASLANASAPAEPAPIIADNPELDALGVNYGTNSEGNYYISIPAEITFPSGKADLTKKGQEALKTVARVLMDKHKGGEFWIEGHTDDDPITKSQWESNRDLSIGRAMAVLHFLVEDCNVPDDKCVVSGHGQYEPLTPNDSSAAKARNRRVEIVVHPG